MDNEHPSNNLSRSSSLESIEVIEEMTVDNDILENFLQEDYDEEAYIDEVYIENNDLMNDQEYNLSQEIESQYQEYNTSHEMENPTNDQHLTPPNNCEPISLIDTDDEDTDNEQLEPTLSIMGEEFLSKINYIQAPKNRCMFPGYNEKVFMELKNLISNKTLNDVVNPSRDCGISKIHDLLRLFVPDLWLNDLIIQQYIKLLIQNCNKNNVLNLGSYFFKDVDKNGFQGFIETSLKKINLLDNNIILVPAHLDDSHWALLIAEMNERKIYVFDSFSVQCESLEEKLSVFVSFLNDEYLDKTPYLNESTLYVWNIITELSPKQENSSDCGVFVCTNARYYLFDKPIDFDQGDIPLIRQRMTYELINNTLLST